MSQVTVHGGSKRKTWRASGVQANSADTIAASTEKALAYIRQAHKERADFVLFPEMYLTGYHDRFDGQEAEEALERIGEAAAQFDVNVLMGTGSKRQGSTQNQVRIFSRTGRAVGAHDKMLLAVPEAAIYAPGQALRAFELDGLCFAVLICNDLWATPRSTRGRIPLLVQEAQDLGASVVFHAISCSGETDPAKREILMDWHVAHHRTWAMRIGITIVAANQPRALGSLVHCGIVGPDGNYVVRVPNKGEQLFVGEITV
jgi:predicted amidohydrolase